MNRSADRSLSPEQWNRFDELVEVLEQKPRPGCQEILRQWVEAGREERPVLDMLIPYFKVSRVPARRYEGGVVGRYELIRLIGEGAMGAVYEAQPPPPLERHIAVKLINPRILSEDARRRFLLEIQTHDRLDHPNIALVIDAGFYQDPVTDQETPFYAMQLIEGGQPLLMHAKRCQMDEVRRLELFLQVCNALAHAHGLGLVHGDLKPENILVDRDHRVRIIDFGMAYMLGTHAPLSVRGTPDYMSPEQADPNGYGPIDIRTDIYSLGIILYELLAGRRPYEVQGQTAEDLRAEIPAAQYTALGDLNPKCRGSLERIVDRALRKQRLERFDSVAELHKAVETAMADFQDEFRWIRKVRDWSAVLLGLGLMVAVLGYLEPAYASSAVTGEWMLINLAVVVMTLSALLDLSQRYFKSLRPIWNNSLVAAVLIGLCCSFICGLFYAYGPAAATDPEGVQRIPHIRMLRFMTVGAILSFAYGHVFAIIAAHRHDPTFNPVGWQALAWILLVAVLAMMIYVSANITEIPLTATFLSAKKQGDVRLEMFVLLSGMASYLMILFENWKALTQTLSVGAFCVRQVIALAVLTGVGSILAATYWGQGLVPERVDASFATFTVLLINGWTFCGFFAFTGRHRLLQRIDHSSLAGQSERCRLCQWIKQLRGQWRYAWFSRAG
jgi:hypothetical protein